MTITLFDIYAETQLIGIGLRNNRLFYTIKDLSCSNYRANSPLVGLLSPLPGKVHMEISLKV